MDVTSDPLYQRLFRLFCLLSEGGVGLLPRQAAFILEESTRLAGRPSTSKHFAFNGELVSFRELLGLLENLFPERGELQTAAQSVFERYVDQVIVKCFVLYRRSKREGSAGCASLRGRNWTNGLCLVQPGELHLYRLNKRRLRSKLIVDLKITSIEGPSFDGERFICTLYTENDDKVLDLAFHDSGSCSTLLTGLRIAQRHQTKDGLLAFDRRNALRFQGSDLDVETEQREKLEKEKQRLQRQLEEERAALKDEEIVRGLATRMLEEERLKSEQMERVLQELQQRLHEREVEEEEYTVPEEAERFIEYANEQSTDPENDDVWRKEDFLIISTQSI